MTMTNHICNIKFNLDFFCVSVHGLSEKHDHKKRNYEYDSFLCITRENLTCSRSKKNRHGVGIASHIAQFYVARSSLPFDEK